MCACASSVQPFWVGREHSSYAFLFLQVWSLSPSVATTLVTTTVTTPALAWALALALEPAPAWAAAKLFQRQIQSQRSTTIQHISSQLPFCCFS